MTTNNVANVACVWALLYIPQGFPDNTIQLHKSDFQLEGAPASLFEPNHNVIMSGWLSIAHEDTVTYRSRLALNLDSSDRMVITIMNPTG
jgi:hypothetical protein